MFSDSTIKHFLLMGVIVLAVIGLWQWVTSLF